MNYSELLKSYSHPEEIPYRNLLETEEWKRKRDQIIRRDWSCCTECGRTSSITFLNRNICILTNERLPLENFSWEEKPLEILKKELGIDTIHILKCPHNDTVFGFSEDGSLYLADWEEINGKTAQDLVINSSRTESAIDFMILGQKGRKSTYNYFPIPQISDKKYYLHVHHKYYVYENLPWEYDDDALITLCNWCHWEFHQNYTVPFYDRSFSELNYNPCSRCGGAGIFPEYNHVQGGVCFKCGGNRYVELIPDFFSKLK